MDRDLYAFAVLISTVAGVKRLSRLPKSRICWVNGSIPKARMVAMASILAINEFLRTMNSSSTAPHGPRLASSNTRRWSRGCGLGRKCCQDSWLRHPAIGTIIALLAIVVNTAISEFGWIGRDQAARARPSAFTRVIRTKLTHIALTIAPPTSHHQHNAVLIHPSSALRRVRDCNSRPLACCCSLAEFGSCGSEHSIAMAITMILLLLRLYRRPAVLALRWPLVCFRVGMSGSAGNGTSSCGASFKSPVSNQGYIYVKAL